jgi:hypothetical protein
MFINRDELHEVTTFLDGWDQGELL